MKTILQIRKLFLEVGFKEINVNNNVLFQYDYSYYKITYLSKWNAVVIESACNKEDVQKNIFEDSDIYCLDEKNLLEKIECDLRQYYIN